MRLLLTILAIGAIASPAVAAPIGPPTYAGPRINDNSTSVSQNSTDLCKTAASAGGGGMNFYFSLGMAFRDDACVQIRQAKELTALGLRAAAVQVMCEDHQVELAMKKAGTPCEQFVEHDPESVLNGH